MLKLGAQNVSALYLGGGKIKKAYVGSALVADFEGKKPSRLPDGYTEVEYIQSDGEQYINTGYSPTVNTKTVIDIQPLSVIYANFFSSIRTYSASGGWIKHDYYLTKMDESGNVMAGISSRQNSPGGYTIKTISANDRVTITLDGANKTASVDDVSVTIDPTSNYALPTLVLLGGNNSGEISKVPVANKMPSKLFSAQMADKSTLVRDYVPCIDPSGVVGLYDLVDKKFYGNAGMGTFAAGPAV